jgi:HEAT repeat protein
MGTVRNKMIVIFVIACAICAGRSFGQVDAKASRDIELSCIKIIESDAPKADKAIPCKKLAIYGSKDAVPALAALLPDPELSSWSRIALEAIPGPESEQALRDALDKAQGRVLIGVINSIGFKHDAKAVDALAAKMKDADADIASAAAAALGKVGTPEALKVLEPALATAPEPVRSAVAEGCIFCAERCLADGKNEEAARIYDAVRKADVPKPRLVEATRGAILSRGNAGIPLLLEQLRSSGAFFNVGLRVARELPGQEAMDALLTEMGKATADRQPLIIIAVGDRNDPKALPAVLELAKSGSIKSRIAAVGVLEKLGNASCVPVLVEGAVGDDAELAQVSKAAMARLKGKEIDADILSRLEQSSGKTRQVLIQLAEERKIPGALPLFAKYVADQDPAARGAALDAIGALGEDKQVPILVSMLQKAGTPEDRTPVEKAIMTICGRWQAACLPHLSPLLKSDQPADRISALHALSAIGGAESLDFVKAAVADKDATVQDEAVRTLSTWPNKWPEDATVLQPLLDVAKNDKKAQHHVLAVRGYLQFIQGAKKTNPGDRLAKLDAILPVITRPEEKRLAISALGVIGTAGAVQPLVAYAADPVVGDEACSAILTLISKNPVGLTKEAKRTALQAVVDHAKSEPLKNRAQGALNAIK